MHSFIISSVVLILGVKYTDGQAYSVWMAVPEAQCGPKVAAPDSCKGKMIWQCQSIVDRAAGKRYTGYACISTDIEMYGKNNPTPAPNDGRAYEKPAKTQPKEEKPAAAAPAAAAVNDTAAAQAKPAPAKGT